MNSPFVVWAFIALALSMVIISVIALIDILKSDFRGRKDKLRWATVVVAGGAVGAILYYAIGTRFKRADNVRAKSTARTRENCSRSVTDAGAEIDRV